MIIPAPFALVNVEFDGSTEMALLLNSVAGYATLTYGPCFPGPGNTTNPTPTGLANDGTTYTATVTVDGTAHVLSLTGSAVQTFPTLIAAINASLTAGVAAAALVNSDIIITSASTGIASSVAVSGAVVTAGSFVRGTVYTITKRGTTDFMAIGAARNAVGITFTATGVGSGTGTASANADTYPLFNSVKGVVAPFAFGISTSASNTHDGSASYAVWTDLDGATQANLSSTITAFLAATSANTNTPWASGTDVLAFTPVAPATTVALNTDTGLLINPTVPYDINIAVDGGTAVNVKLNLYVPVATASSPVTFSQLLQSLNLAMAAAGLNATAAFLQGALGVLTITSNSVGTGSTIAITAGTSHDLIGALVAFVPANGPLAGYETVTFSNTPASSTVAITTSATYYFKVATDGGAVIEYSIVAGVSPTFATLAGLLQTAWGLGTVTYAATGPFLFTSTTVGATSSVVITPGTTGGDVFARISLETSGTPASTKAAVAGVGGAAGVNGVTNASFPETKLLPAGNENSITGNTAFTNWNDVVQLWPAPTGFGALYTRGGGTNKRNTPTAKGQVVRTAVYYDGTNWVYFENGASVGGTGTTIAPPELKVA